jgi:DNA-binding NarL/FixJ family response regulator
MDFSMPGMNGVEATRRITGELPHVKVIGLSMYDEADRARAMLDAGAVAYVSKNGKARALIELIRARALAS